MQRKKAVNPPFKQPCSKTHHGHILGWQCQDPSGSNWKNGWEGAWRIIFTHE